MIPLPRDKCLEARRRSLGGELRFDRSPLQTGLAKDPWLVAIASQMLSRTRHQQVRRALRNFLHRWDSPEAVAVADRWDISPYLHPLGFGERRTKLICDFCVAWCGQWQDLRDLPGVGVYVADAVGLFCFGCTDIVCSDHALVEHILELTQGHSNPHSVVAVNPAIPVTPASP